jgi:peptidoglycan hydrolase CwlO-like protein
MRREILDSIVLLEFGCWIICFWWMHKISVKQNALLEQLHDQAHRIEKVAKEEHAIVKELHPAVQNIEKVVGEVAESTDRIEGAPPQIGSA